MSEIILTDQEIEKLVKEPKPLPYDWRRKNQPVINKIEIIQTVQVIGKNNSIFILKLRQNPIKIIIFV